MYKGTWSNPASKAEPLTPSDTVVYDYAYRAIYVGTGGTITLIPVENLASVTFENVPDGTILPVSVKKLLATGTSATNIIGLH